MLPIDVGIHADSLTMASFITSTNDKIIHAAYRL